LSLDAPTVTMLWQWLLAHVAHVSLSWYHYAIVGTSIWLSYAADRWLESWRVPAARLQTPRHQFYLRHRRVTAGVWCGALAGALWLSFTRLTGRELAAGSLLLVPVLVYLLSHQLVHRGYPWRLPKEVCVAGLLGGGAAVFAACAPAVRVAALAEGGGWFVALAFVNCSLIGRWEQTVDRAQGQDSLILWYPWSGRVVPLLPWMLLAGAAVGWMVGHGDLRTLRACAAVSAGLLGLIDRAERRTGWPIARVLADAALLTPAVWLAAGWLSS
jgi:hypothetical protein